MKWVIKMDYSFLIPEVYDKEVVGCFLPLFVAHDVVGNFKGRVSKVVQFVQTFRLLNHCQHE